MLRGRGRLEHSHLLDTTRFIKGGEGLDAFLLASLLLLSPCPLGGSLELLLLSEGPLLCPFTG